MVGTFGRIAAFFGGGAHDNNNVLKEGRKGRRRRRHEPGCIDENVPVDTRSTLSVAGSSEDVRFKFSRKNPMWSSLRDLRFHRRASVVPPQLTPSVVALPIVATLPAQPRMKTRTYSQMIPPEELPTPPPTPPMLHGEDGSTPALTDVCKCGDVRRRMRSQSVFTVVFEGVPLVVAI